MEERALLITGCIFWPYFLISQLFHGMKFQVHWRPEPLLISDPGVYTVTYTMGAKDATQMNPLYPLQPILLCP